VKDAVATHGRGPRASSPFCATPRKRREPHRATHSARSLGGGSRRHQLGHESRPLLRLLLAFVAAHDDSLLETRNVNRFTVSPEALTLQPATREGGGPRGRIGASQQAYEARPNAD
jgi:hypothetical protein